MRKLLETACPGRVKAGVKLEALTTWRIGGPADWLVEPGSIAELRHLVRSLADRNQSYVVLGKGSNLLIGDRGVRGVVILIGTALAWICHPTGPGRATRLEIGAGTPLSRVVRYGLLHALTGLEFLTGIPGSIGGAWAMNAGVGGQEMGDLTLSLTLVTPRGELVQRPPNRLRFGYRHLDLAPGEIIVTGQLRVVPGLREDIARSMRSRAAMRRKTQPGREPSCGSVFKNPPGDFAGRLIEAAGCKGMRRGDAQVSQKHANFIVNRGRARARDVLTLMRTIRSRVRKQSGIILEPEVRMWGCSLKPLPAVSGPPL